MTLEMTRPNEILALVNTEKGTVDRRIFSDQSIYEMELEHIFARAWQFMAHDSQIPNPGDFFMNFMGEDRVIVVRDNDGQPQVLINSCRHRGNAVCRAEEGHASSFMCTYHGWTYDLKGNLVGVPGFKEVYHEELDREHWGLIKAAKVATFKGFVFATMDPEAPEFEEYLGDSGRLTMNTVAMRMDNQCVAGIQKYIIPCNWKFAVDNVWDYYHGITTHASNYMADRKLHAGQLDTSGRYRARHLVFPGEYGHVLAGPASMGGVNGNVEMTAREARNAWRQTPDALHEMGRVGVESGGHPHIFPNFWVTGSQAVLRLPRGPLKTEHWFFTFTDKNWSKEERHSTINRAIHGFGPGGLMEQDDGENWGESTKGTTGVITRRYPLNYSLGVGKGEIQKEEGSPAYIDTKINENAQLWHYRSWAEWMAASSWDDLKAHHSRPEGIV